MTAVDTSATPANQAVAPAAIAVPTSGGSADKPRTSTSSRKTCNQARSWSSVHLDAIRGCAALVVVAGHERGLFLTNVTASAVPPRPLEPGFVHQRGDNISIGDEAVIVFFVLSGYLVGGSVVKAFARQNWSWTDYLLRRMTRLWTVLIPALLLGMTIDFVGMHAFAGAGGIYDAPFGQDCVETKNFGDIWSLRIFFGNLAFLQGILTPLAGTNKALWSLSYEFWYYIAFPMLLFALVGRTGGKARIAYAAGCGLILWFIGSHAASMFMIWLLGVGVALTPRKLPALAAQLATLAAPLALVATFLLVKSHIANPDVAEFTIALIFAAILYAILHRTTKASPGIYSAAARFISEISYTLYLTHLPLLIFLCAIFNRPWRLEALGGGSLAIFGLVLALSVFYAWLLYLAFESRTDRFRAAIARRLNG